MPERYWDGRLAIVAILAVIVFVAGYLLWHESARLAEQKIRDEQRAQAHIEYAEDRIDENCLSLVGVPLRDCIHEEIQAAQDHSRAEGDLDAQQVMARFTRIMGYTGIAGVVLGGVSVVLILMTLWETSAGVRVMRSEQRPWVDILKPNVKKARFGAGSGEIDLLFPLENTGQSPAQNVQVVVTPEVSPDSLHQISSSALESSSQASHDGATILPRKIIDLHHHIGISVENYSYFPSGGTCIVHIRITVTYGIGPDFYYTSRLYSLRVHGNNLIPAGVDISDPEAELVGLAEYTKVK